MAENSRNGDMTVNQILKNRMMWQDPIAMHQMEVLANSTLMSRQALLQRGGGEDPRRNLNEECGYPEEITAEDYRKLYDREPIASRVVQVLPMECWQVTPLVYEDEDVEVTTPFEQAWHDLGKSLRGDSYFQDDEGSPVIEACMRIDVLSGIGSFGVILLGIDDGKRLDEPVDGFTDSLQVGGSMASTYGTDAQYGSITLMPGPEKKKIPGTLNAFPVRRPEDEDDTTEQGLGPQEDVTYDEGEPPIDGDMPEEIPGDPEDMQDFPDPEELEEEAEAQTQRKLLFMRCFDETLVQIVQYESDPTNVRFGQPVMYNITLNDPKFQHSGSGLSMNVAKVHWSRVLHVADNLGSSEIFGVPRMQTVYNRLLDLRKLLSGSAEMYWKGAFPGYSLQTHPQLGGDVSFDSDDIKDQMEAYMNGLQRYTAFVGSSLNSLAPQVVDPTSQIQVQLESICVRLAVPMRVFMGSERGELASSQDAGTWNDRLKQRQNGYLTPRLLVPLIDRLIKMKVLPEPNYVPPEKPDSTEMMDGEEPGMEGMDGMDFDPEAEDTDQFTGNVGWEGQDEEKPDFTNPFKPPNGSKAQEKRKPRGGYSIEWPDLSAASDLEKAQKASMQTQALSGYVQGGIENVMTFTDYLVHVMGFDEATAMQINENSMMQEQNQMMTIDPAMEEEMQRAQIEQMTNPELVPDNIQTGEQSHYEAGSLDKEAELEHERKISGVEGGPPMPPGQEGPPMEGGDGKMPVMPVKGKGKKPSKKGKF